MRAALLAAALMLVTAPVRAAEGEIGPDQDAAQVDAAAQVRRADAVLRGERTHLEGRLSVEPRRGAPRQVEFRVWDDRPRNRTLLRIVAPGRLSGTGLLRLPPNLWEHDPRQGRTARVAGAALLEPWLGSDFGRIDLLQASLPEEDYRHRLLRIDVPGAGDDAERSYVIESLPAREGAGLWGRVVSWISVEHGTPLRRECYDRAGAPRRLLRFEEVREREGRRVPHRWVATTPGVEGRVSRVELVSIDFEAAIEPELFTTRHLTHP